MTTHLTARIAWHDDGWNGRVITVSLETMKSVRSLPALEI